MNEFLFVFRRDYTTPNLQPTPDQLQAHLKHWADWFRSLAVQDKLAYPVQRYDGQGKIIKGNETADGPYIDGNEKIGGVLLVKAADYEEAVRLAEGCPILELGGNVEVRQAL